MATTRTRTIKSSGGDYTTVAGWEAGEAANIVAGDEIRQGVVYASAGPLTENGQAFNSGWTTDSTRYIELIVNTADRHTGKIGTGLIWTLNNTIRPVTAAKQVRITGFNFQAVLSGHFALDDNGGSWLFNSCIFDGGNLALGDKCIKASTTAFDSELRNCFITRIAGGNDACYVIKYLRHCTAWHNTVNRLYVGNTGGVIKNCLALDITGTCVVDNGSTVSYTIIDDTSATGTGVLQSRSVTDNASPGAGNWVVLTDISTGGSEDLNLKTSSENDAEGAGVADYATDYRGFTRADPPDVGAHEIGTSGSAVPLFTANYQQR